MTKKFKSDTHIKRVTRNNGTYFFTTLCTEEGNEFFGKMKNGKLEISRSGEIAKSLWEEIPERIENIQLGDYTLMPNHIHAIFFCSFKNGKSQILKAVESSIKAIEGYRESVIEKIRSTNPRTKFNWAKDFNIYTIKDENELYDMRYYIEKESMKWEFDSENARNKLYISKGKK